MSTKYSKAVKNLREEKVLDIMDELKNDYVIKPESKCVEIDMDLSVQNNLFLEKELLHFSQVMHQIVLPCCVPIENGKWHDGEWCALR